MDAPEKPNKPNKSLLISVAIAVIIAGVLGIVVMLNTSEDAQAPNTEEVAQQEEAPSPTPTPKPADSLGAQAFEESSNPLKGEALEANPFRETKNPFSDAYKNPFE